MFQRCGLYGLHRLHLFIPFLYIFKVSLDWILIPTSFNSFSFSLKGEEILTAFWFLLDLRDSNSSRGSFRYWSERQCCWIKK
ncbi:hypothetical protein L2E82_02770 [Cichorium intybus]|uniref:Uncharacterized protein n=1 Tax=Cichorium intybus TaxID=13427 RepID=A0ACB9H337_CICIN|nr:hypothetical protein L2E82_02770 [Cichorium intybus]